MPPFCIPCSARKESSAWAMMSTMAFPIPTTSSSGCCIPFSLMTALGRAAIVLWTALKREASLSKRKPAEEQAREKHRQDERVDEQSAESFPASDPPSYAGG